MEIKSICELVRKSEEDWTTGTTTHSKYVEFNIYDTLNRIDAYLNSKHISGETDAKGREKPFFDIVTAAANIWYRATDIDRKDIRIKVQKDFIKSLLANIHLQEWMKREAFGAFLNNWGRTLSRYGSAVLKFVEKNGELHKEVIPWNRIICDSVDFDANPVVEKIWLTPAQLHRRIETHGYDEDFVEQIIEKNATTIRTDLDDQTRDNKADYIPVYEIHGDFSEAFYKKANGEDWDKEDEINFSPKMFVVSFIENNETSTFDDYILFKGREKQSPYMITHLIEEDGQVLSIGAVQHLFEAQWMANHSQKLIKDQLDLASKLFFQTSDGNFIGRNALTSIENGDIMISAPNQPITQVQNNSHDITSLQNFNQVWQNVGKEINSTPDATRGATPPSGTAFRLEALKVRQGESLFELMTENKGLYIEEMMRRFILPFLKTKMDTSDEIVATLEQYQLTQIDAIYLPNEAKRRVNTRNKEAILNGELPITGAEQEEAIATERTGIEEQLGVAGNQRTFKPSDISDKTWKEYFKNFEWTAEVEVTGEQNDKEATLTTLNTTFQIIAGLAGRELTPQEKLIFDKIMNEAGSLSPVELSVAKSQPQPALVGEQTTPEVEIK